MQATVQGVAAGLQLLKIFYGIREKIKTGGAKRLAAHVAPCCSGPRSEEGLCALCERQYREEAEGADEHEQDEEVDPPAVGVDVVVVDDGDGIGGVGYGGSMVHGQRRKGTDVPMARATSTARGGRIFEQWQWIDFERARLQGVSG